MKFLYFVLAISIALVSGSPAYEYGTTSEYESSELLSRRPLLVNDGTTRPTRSARNLVDWADSSGTINPGRVEDNKLIYTLVSSSGVEAGTEYGLDLEIATATNVPRTDPEECTCGKSKTICEDGWVTFGNKCLKLKYTPETYVTASNLCRDEHNARILTIQSQEEQTFFEKLFIETGIGKSIGRASEAVYLGLERCPRTGFHWVGPNETKIPVTYKNWDIGEPQSMAGIGAEACAAMVLRDMPNRHPIASYGKWHDYGCDRQHMFVCEKEGL